MATLDVYEQLSGPACSTQERGGRPLSLTVNPKTTQGMCVPAPGQWVSLGKEGKEWMWRPLVDSVLTF